jgi:hypothetical protein
MTSPDTVLEQRLAAAFDRTLSSAQVAALDARVEAWVQAGAPRPRRHRAVRTVLLLAALFVIVPSILGVGAAIMSTEDPFGLTDADGFQAELDSAMAITPIPAGATWPDFLSADPNVAYSAGGGRAWVELVSMCLWEVEWLHARAAADAAREALARTTIIGFPDWYSTDSVFFQPDGSRAAYLAPIVAGVRIGDPTALARDVELNCSGMTPFVAP